MSLLWSSATILRFAQKGEELLAMELKCLVDRIALGIRANYATYSLPSYALGIRRVTWLGQKVWPIPHSVYVEHFQPQLGGVDLGAFDSFVYSDAFDARIDLATPTGKPDYYIFNTVGRNTIRFYPAPNVAVESIKTNLWGSEIGNRVIVEFYRLPSFTTEDIRFPPWMRRRVIKLYVLSQCFAIEGDGQDMKAAAYFDKKFQSYLKLCHKMYSKLFVSKIRRYDIETSRFRPQRAVLPWQYQNEIVDY